MWGAERCLALSVLINSTHIIVRYFSPVALLDSRPRKPGGRLTDNVVYRALDGGVNRAGSRGTCGRKPRAVSG